MASGGGKNIVLIVIAIGAIAGAGYLLTQSMGNSGSIDTSEKKYFVLEGTETSDSPKGVTMSIADYNARVRNKRPIEIDGSTSVLEAGMCPNGHYYPLGGHGAMPPACTSCGVSLAGYDRHGNKAGGG